MHRMNCIATTSLVVLATASVSQAAISLTNGSPSYSQNFNSLPATGSVTFVNDSTLSGWYHARTGTGTAITAHDGDNNTGGFYSFGTGTNTDRAMGSTGSGTPGNMAWGARFINSGASVINSVQVSYTGEQWRNSAATAQTMTFFYRSGGTTFDTLTAGWTAETLLDFTSPITGGTADGIDGNLAANKLAKSATITFGTPIAVNGEFWLKYIDVDHGGADHGLSSDDFSVIATFAPVPEPTAVAALAAVALVALRRRPA